MTAHVLSAGVVFYVPSRRLLNSFVFNYEG